MILNIDPSLKYVIPQLRKQYGDLYCIDLTEVPGMYRCLIIRPLTRREFFQIMADVELGCDVSDVLLETCIVYPSLDWSNVITNKLYDLPCMDFEAVSNIIMEISGFPDDKQISSIIDTARKESNSLDSIIALTICKTFTGITPDMLDDMNMKEIAHWFAMAEQLLPEPIDVRFFLDPKYAERVVRKMNRGKSSRPPSMTRRDPIGPPPEGWQTSSQVPAEMMQ